MRWKKRDHVPRQLVLVRVQALAVRLGLVLVIGTHSATLPLTRLVGFEGRDSNHHTRDYAGPLVRSPPSEDLDRFSTE